MRHSRTFLRFRPVQIAPRFLREAFRCQFFQTFRIQLQTAVTTTDARLMYRTKRPWRVLYREGEKDREILLLRRATTGNQRMEECVDGREGEYFVFVLVCAERINKGMPSPMLPPPPPPPPLPSRVSSVRCNSLRWAHTSIHPHSPRHFRPAFVIPMMAAGGAFSGAVTILAASAHEDNLPRVSIFPFPAHHHHPLCLLSTSGASF